MKSSSLQTIPLFLQSVSAGFPSPSDNYIEQNINLHNHFVPHPHATFFVRAEGNSMIGAGIFSGDLLIVDRSKTAQHQHVIIAVLDGELTLKRLYKKDRDIILQSENPDYPNLSVDSDMEFSIWGVVTTVIHTL